MGEWTNGEEDVDEEVAREAESHGDCDGGENRARNEDSDVPSVGPLLGSGSATAHEERTLIPGRVSDFLGIAEGKSERASGIRFWFPRRREMERRATHAGSWYSADRTLVQGP